MTSDDADTLRELVETLLNECGGDALNPEAFVLMVMTKSGGLMQVVSPLSAETVLELTQKAAAHYQAMLERSKQQPVIH